MKTKEHTRQVRDKRVRQGGPTPHFKVFICKTLKTKHPSPSTPCVCDTLCFLQQSPVKHLNVCVCSMTKTLKRPRGTNTSSRCCNVQQSQQGRVLPSSKPVQTLTGAADPRVLRIFPLAAVSVPHAPLHSRF